MIDLIRRVVSQELGRSRGSALGVVTAIFPHTAADDDNNYEASVRLKHSELTLPKVPIAAGHVGAAAAPRVGDLVLVQFIDGDLNQPVIAGRFYHEEARPPIHRAEELLFEQRLGDDSLSQLRFADDGSIQIQRKVDPEDGYKAAATIRITADGNIEILAGEKTRVVLTNDGEIEILAENKAISITCKELTLNGDLTVKGTGGSTKISGNQITGA